MRTFTRSTWSCRSACASDARRPHSILPSHCPSVPSESQHWQFLGRGDEAILKEEPPEVPASTPASSLGTSIYLTIAALFVAQATNVRLTGGQQEALLILLILSSQGRSGRDRRRIHRVGCDYFRGSPVKLRTPNSDRAPEGLFQIGHDGVVR